MFLFKSFLKKGSSKEAFHNTFDDFEMPLYFWGKDKYDDIIIRTKWCHCSRGHTPFVLKTNISALKIG